MRAVVARKIVDVTAPIANRNTQPADDKTGQGDEGGYDGGWDPD
jgi:hypothetical protein